MHELIHAKCLKSCLIHKININIGVLSEFKGGRLDSGYES